ncbi:MAG: class II aldolase/adducin family protein [Dehalococcoidia bacterium]|nr:class II aldolase/adducin family protein [Dehalococcoidia bacterium]
MTERSSVNEARALIARVGKLMLDRNLTDLAGGNISVRVDDRIVMSPSYAGTHKFWQLEPEEVLVLDLKGHLMEGSGKISREFPTHIKLLNSFYPQGQAVIHAHARNVMVFCAVNLPIPPVLEYTYKFGEIKLAEYARGGIHGEQLAENVCKALAGQESIISRQAAAVLVPWHGLFAIGKDLLSTLDAVERIEVNARSILYAHLLPGGEKRLDICSADLAEHMRSTEGNGE